MSGFGLLGEKLGHSFSPMIHSMLGDYEYRLYPTPREELDRFLRSGEFQGLNVTIPYKQTVMPYCTELSPAAKSIGSVNTLIRRDDGTLLGDNTDYFGFEYLVKSSGVSVENKKCLVLGSGGASKTVCAVLRDMGAGSVTVISRSGEDNYTNLENHAYADIIVNTTPVGMYPDTGLSPVDLTVFPGCAAVFDVVYNPANTELLLRAEELGIPGFNGLAMLAAQAKRAAELFTGRSIPDSDIERITSRIARDTKNIALVGMPGCGKSHVGRLLAESLSRDFIDLDVEIEKHTGTSPADIITTRGEAAFRQIETQVLSEFSRGSGAVISTGGGVVTVPENLRLLRQNSTVIYLSREIKDLARKGRPLSGDDDVMRAMYEKRLPMYLSFRDFEVKNSGSVQDAVERIMEVLGY